MRSSAEGEVDELSGVPRVPVSQCCPKALWDSLNVASIRFIAEKRLCPTIF